MFGVLALACSVASAQSARAPVRMLAGFPPGGNVDLLARLLAEKLGESLDRHVVVENRPGAGGQIALELVKAAAPDGNTLVLTPDASIVLRPLTMKNPPYDPRTGQGEREGFGSVESARMHPFLALGQGAVNPKLRRE